MRWRAPEPPAPRAGALRRGFALLVAALLAALVAKAVFFLAGGQPPLRWDTRQYWHLADILAGGRGFAGWAVERPPGYPMLIAAAQLLFGGRALFALAALQQLAGIAGALLCGDVARRIARSRAALPLVLALDLLCIERSYLGLYALADTLLCVGLVAYVAILVRWLARPAALTAGATGLVLGAVTLVKPLPQLAWLPSLAVMGLRARLGAERLAPRRFALHAACLLGAFALAVAPWLVRNQRAHGEAFLVAFTGRSLWWSAFGRGNAGLRHADGDASLAVGAALEGSGVDLHEPWDVWTALREGGRDGREAERLMLAATREAIAEQPLVFARSVAQRTAAMWFAPHGNGYWRGSE